MKVLFVLGLALLLRAVHGAPDYTIVAPKAFRIGVDETVVLNLHEYEGARVSAYLQDLPDRASIFGQIEAKDYTAEQCAQPIALTMKVSSDDIPVFLNRQKVLMVIDVTNSVNDFSAQYDVLVSKDSGYLFVRTDRPIYRPGEYVLIQVAPLNQLMAPSDNQIVTVTVKTPDKVGVFRRRLRLPENNFIELEYEVTFFPELGRWFVEAEYSANGFETSTETTFRIERYVLPTFNVEVQLDQNYFLPNDLIISGKVKATYSYGEKVSGNYYVSAKVLRFPDAAPIEFFKQPGEFYNVALIRNGEAAFQILVDNLLEALIETGDTIETLIENEGSFFIEATVTGGADAVLESAISRKIPFLRSPYIFDISRTSLFYTPGIAYQLRADLLDSVRKKPSPNVPVLITVTENGEENTYPDTGSSDLGQVNYQLDFTGSGIKTIELRTSDQELADVGDQAEVIFRLFPYESSSNSYLQMSSGDPFATVGQTNFFVTISHNQDSLGEIRYLVVSRGSIVAQGTLVPVVGTEESSLRLTITQNMVPEIRVVAYYLVGTEAVSNSLWIDVFDECKDDLVVTVPEEVLPGGRVKFDIQGSSNALVGISGVDRAAYFISNESRLTPDKMFDKMESYDQGCIRNGGNDNRNVFLNAGLVLSSPHVSAYQVDTLDCPEQGQVARKRKKRQVVDEKEVRMEKKLSDCDRDGRLAAINGENCLERGNRVFENTFEDYRNCFRLFRLACLEARRERTSNPAGRSSGIQSQIDLSIARQRTDFQESLIFSTVRLDGDGKASFSRKARDSITTFEIDAISMQNQPDGFCVADTSELLVFKDVFIQLYIPFSLKLREQASIRLTVFNYAELQNYVVDIEVKPDPTFCTHYTKDEWSVRRNNVRLDSNTAVSDSFAVIPLEIPPGGYASLEVRVLVNQRILDSIRKEILIEPEGQVKDTYQSYPLAEPFPSSFDITFDFPEQFLPGSRSCEISAYTNFLGPSIEVDPRTGEPKDIDSIFSMPRGCGEQNMLFCGPNVYAHFYLESVGKLNEDIQPQYRESIKRMEDGYKLELTYRSELADPIYSAFAVWKNRVPSTWLNAFVDKVFSKAKEYFTDLNVGPICKSLNFLIGEQQQDGHFREKRAPYHREMVGAVVGQFTLTSYVLIALAESASVCPDLSSALAEAKANAVMFLENNKDDRTFRERPYAIALLTYALSLFNPTSDFAVEMNTRLLAYQQVTDDNRMVFWQGRPLSDIAGTELHDYWYRRKPQAIDVETTAYALLAQIEFAKSSMLQQEDLDRIRKIAMWLVSQRNQGGAFISTQDTVIGLQALATYEVWLFSLNPVEQVNDLQVTITTPGKNTSWGDETPYVFSLTENNNGFKKLFDVPYDVITSGGASVAVEGVGEGVLSYRCLYRTVVEEGSCHFQINYNVEYTNLEQYMDDENVLLRMKLTITVSKRVGSSALMSIIDVGLLSGFVPVQETVSRLSKQEFVDGVVERYEITNQNLILYLTQVDRDQVSVTFDMVQNVRVQKPQPAEIKVFDYYEPSVSCAIFYALPDSTPDIRTVNCDGLNDDSLCSCAEGGCLKCRSRRQQLEETACLNEEDCPICQGGNCDNMYEAACRSNYAYVINVTQVLQYGSADVFVSFIGRIEIILKYGDDLTAQPGVEQTFMARRDCYESCKDPEFYEAQRNEDKPGDFVREGYFLAVMGATPDMGLDRSGNQFHHYRLDDGAIMERHIPKETCTRHRDRYARLQCNDPTKQKNDRQRDRCADSIKVKAACDNFDEVARRLREGCD